MLKQTLLTTSLIGLLSMNAFAASRYYVLDFATLNPPNLSTNMKDSRNPSDNFKASGNLELNDDTHVATRTLKLCLNNVCTEKTENYAITGYAPGTSAVFLRDQSSGADHSMVFIWNYFNLGFMETLPNSWGNLGNQAIAISWKDDNAGGNTGGGTKAEYTLTNVRKVAAGGCSGHSFMGCIKGTFTNTSGKAMSRVFLSANLYQNNAQVANTNDVMSDLANGRSWNFELNTITYVFDEFEMQDPSIFYNK